MILALSARSSGVPFMLLPLPGVRQIRTFFVLKEVIDGASLEF
jgi:hypothetical protein